MKLLLAITILLSVFTIYSERKNVSLRHELTAVTDTLNNVLIAQRERQEAILPPIMRAWQEEPLRSHSKNAVEVDRIIGNYGELFFMVRLERKQDGTITAVYKKARPLAPLNPGNFNTVGLKVDSMKYQLDTMQFQAFKSRLQRVDFLNASMDANIMCCFGGGVLEWESITGNGPHHRFKTFCRQSTQFAEACEFLLKKINDPELQQVLSE